MTEKRQGGSETSAPWTVVARDERASAAAWTPLFTGGRVVVDQWLQPRPVRGPAGELSGGRHDRLRHVPPSDQRWRVDRKSTRLNSSHLGISYAGFCLK